MVVVGGVAGVLVAAELEAPTAQELESEDIYTFGQPPSKGTLLEVMQEESTILLNCQSEHHCL